MGLGSDMVLRLVAEEADPNPEIDEGQIVYVAQRHDLLEAAADKLREHLRAGGWSAAAIDENVIILRGRYQGAEALCRKVEEARMVVAAGGEASQSLCRRPAAEKRPEVRCEFFEICEWQKVQRQAGRARFIFMTHAHLTSQWPPVGTPGKFHPQNAKLIIVDEDPTSTLFDQEPTRIKAGTFKELVPGLGEKIEEALTRPNALDFLREAGITADQIYMAAEARKRRETQRPIGHPGMSKEQRIAAVERSKERPRVEKLSRWLTHLADEMMGGRTGECLSLRQNSESGDILARGRKQLWETGGQKWLVLDGTAEVEELRLFLPKIQEVRIDAPRNAIIIQVESRTYSKNTTIKDGRPTELLATAGDFVELMAKSFSGSVGVFTTKAIRKALTGEVNGDKFDVFVPFRGARLGHYGNLRGSNDFEDCEVGFLIGRGERPLEVIEAETRALQYDAPTPIKMVEPDKHGIKRLENKWDSYTMKSGRRAGAQVSRHPDRRCQRRNETTREAEMLQALDRLRLIHNPAPKLIFVLTNLPLPVPVDLLIPDTLIRDSP